MEQGARPEAGYAFTVAPLGVKDKVIVGVAGAEFGVRGFLAAFDGYEPDWDVLRAFGQPVYFVLGGRSNPDLYALMAERLAQVFSDFTLDVSASREQEIVGVAVVTMFLKPTFSIDYIKVIMNLA
jgi:hypothetical protein